MAKNKQFNLNDVLMPWQKQFLEAHKQGKTLLYVPPRCVGRSLLRTMLCRMEGK